MEDHNLENKMDQEETAPRESEDGGEDRIGGKGIECVFVGEENNYSMETEDGSVYFAESERENQKQQAVEQRETEENEERLEVCEKEEGVVKALHAEENEEFQKECDRNIEEETEENVEEQDGEQEEEEEGEQEEEEEENAVIHFVDINDLTATPQKNTSEPNKTYTCSLCQKKLASRWSLHKHMQNHPSASGFKCDGCSKYFGSDELLNEHRNRRKHVCRTCGKAYCIKSSYYWHKAKHREEGGERFVGHIVTD